MVPVSLRSRDSHSQFMVQTMAQSGKAKGLFDLPPEIRVFVYQHYFSDEELQLHPYRRTLEIGPHTIRHKTPILQSNRLVLTEALPVFYQHYLFRIQVPVLKSVKFPPECPPQMRRSEDIRYLTPVLPLITRLELVDPHHSGSSHWNRKMAPYLRCLRDHCPKLRFLRLNMKPMWLLGGSYPRAICNSESSGLLAQLTQRLDRLQIIFVHGKEDKIMEVCEFIAPEACWSQDAFMEVQEGEMRTSVWSFHHGTKALEETRMFEPPADGAATTD